MDSEQSKDSVIEDIYEAIRKQISNADKGACKFVANSIISSLDTFTVKVPLRELTPDMISNVELNQYSNERSDDNLEFHDVSQINFSLQIYIDNWFGRKPNIRLYYPEDPIVSPDSTIVDIGVAVYKILNPE